MEEAAYRALARTEDEGWYYQCRRIIIKKLLARLCLPDPQSAQIMDVGAGTGGSTQALSSFGQVTAVEPSPIARTLLRGKYPQMKVIPASLDQLEGRLPPRENMDLITVLGVLYHKNVKSPAAALALLHRYLKPGGYLVWNEGCYEILKRSHDRHCLGARRFHPLEMVELLSSAGFEVTHRSQLLAWAWPAAFLLALWDRLWGKKTPTDAESVDSKTSSGFLSKFLKKLTLWEWALVKPPFGVSCLIVARKLGGSDQAVS